MAYCPKIATVIGAILIVKNTVYQRTEYGTKLLKLYLTQNVLVNLIFGQQFPAFPVMLNRPVLNAVLGCQNMRENMEILPFMMVESIPVVLQCGALVRWIVTKHHMVLKDSLFQSGKRVMLPIWIKLLLRHGLDMHLKLKRFLPCIMLRILTRDTPQDLKLKINQTY